MVSSNNLASSTIKRCLTTTHTGDGKDPHDKLQGEGLRTNSWSKIVYNAILTRSPIMGFYGSINLLLNTFKRLIIFLFIFIIQINNGNYYHHSFRGATINPSKSTLWKHLYAIKKFQKTLRKNNYQHQVRGLKMSTSFNMRLNLNL